MRWASGWLSWTRTCRIGRRLFQSCTRKQKLATKSSSSIGRQGRRALYTDSWLQHFTTSSIFLLERTITEGGGISRSSAVRWSRLFDKYPIATASTAGRCDGLVSVRHRSQLATVNDLSAPQPTICEVDCASPFNSYLDIARVCSTLPFFWVLSWLSSALPWQLRLYCTSSPTRNVLFPAGQ